MTTQPKHLTIRYYRLVDGLRTPYRLVLDANRDIVSEEVDQEELKAIMASPYLRRRAMMATTTRAKSGGITTTTQRLADQVERGNQYPGAIVTQAKPGTRVIRMEDITHGDSEFAKFSVATAPNPWPQYEDLRQQMFADEQALLDSNPDCQPCELGKIRKRYRRQISGLLGRAI